MYKATVKHVAMGKNEPTALYCKSKSGNVYKFRTPVPVKNAPTIIAKIKSAKVINTKHWIKLAEGKAPTAPTIESLSHELTACESLAEHYRDQTEMLKEEIAELTADLGAQQDRINELEAHAW
jgi:hypothetical protein